MHDRFVYHHSGERNHASRSTVSALQYFTDPGRNHFQHILPRRDAERTETS